MFVLIGCPVYKRDWILDYWFDAIEKQDFPLEDIGFIFLGAPDDYATLEKLLRFHAAHPEIRCFDITVDDQEEHMHHLDGHRHWPRERYYVMAKFRNQLLDKVNCYNPDRYYSLDTDILLEDPTTISQLVELTEDLPAVGTLLFMTPDNSNFPSVMNWFSLDKTRAFRRQDYPYGSLFRSDVIMASVMMTPPVYSQVRYVYHPQGEDVGWSAECAVGGIELYSASYIYTPHIMSTAALDTYLKVGDPRGESVKKPH